MAEEFCNFLFIIGFTKSKKKINDVKLIRRILVEIPRLVNMHILDGPYVKDCMTRVLGKDGISGNVLIGDIKLEKSIIGNAQLEESHINFHSFTNKKRFFFEIFSCIPFRKSKVTSYIKKIFKSVELKKVLSFKVPEITF